MENVTILYSGEEQPTEITHFMLLGEHGLFETRRMLYRDREDLTCIDWRIAADLTK